jgi:hypothetical protein
LGRRIDTSRKSSVILAGFPAIGAAAVDIASGGDFGIDEFVKRFAIDIIGIAVEIGITAGTGRITAYAVFVNAGTADFLVDAFLGEGLFNLAVFPPGFGPGVGCDKDKRKNEQ